MRKLAVRTFGYKKGGQRGYKHQTIRILSKKRSQKLAKKGLIPQYYWCYTNSEDNQYDKSFKQRAKKIEALSKEHKSLWYAKILVYEEEAIKSEEELAKRSSTIIHGRRGRIIKKSYSRNSFKTNTRNLIEEYDADRNFLR